MKKPPFSRQELKKRTEPRESFLRFDPQPNDSQKETSSFQDVTYGE